MPNTTPHAERKNLVIACGHHNLACRHCGNHPQERWVSIDPYDAQGPDIQKNIQEVIPVDFSNRGLSTTYEIIYVESIGETMGTKQLNAVIPLLAEGGAYVQKPNTLQSLFENNLTIQFEYFIYDMAAIICVKPGGNLERLLNTMKEDLPRDFKDENGHVNAIFRHIEQISTAYPAVNHMLVSALAHIEFYVDNRTQRYCRNFFKDRLYEDFLEDMRSHILGLHPDQDLSSLSECINAWKERLPSSDTPSYKLNYTPLSLVLDNCLAAIRYDFELRSKQQVAERTSPSPR